MGNREDARAAIAAANQAFKSWRKVSAHERAELLHEVARKIRARTEELATLLTGEGGKPLIENHDEIVWSEARAPGARILAGGRRLPQFERGFFYEPTVLTNVDHWFRIRREETFGPAIPIMAYRSFDEAIALANDSDYGLGANLYTNDPRKVKQYYEEIKAGTCWVNDPLTDNEAGPFGGMKFSRGARELGEEGLEEFLETKHVH